MWLLLNDKNYITRGYSVATCNTLTLCLRTPCVSVCVRYCVCYCECVLSPPLTPPLTPPPSETQGGSVLQGAPRDDGADRPEEAAPLRSPDAGPEPGRQETRHGAPGLGQRVRRTHSHTHVTLHWSLSGWSFSEWSWNREPMKRQKLSLIWEMEAGLWLWSSGELMCLINNLL